MFKRYRLPILAGLLIGTSYIPFPPWALFFCLVPLWLFVLKAENLRQALWAGFITQFILNAIGFHWIAYTAVEFGHFPWIVGVIVLVLFCATAHLYFPASTALYFWINKRWPLRPLPAAFLLASLLALFKMIFPVLFPWHFGYPWLWASLPGAQAADLIGFEGLNIASIFINALVMLAWINRGQKTLAIRYAATAVTVFALLNIVGVIRKNSVEKPDAEIKVLTVQGNIGNWEKVMAEKGKQFQDTIVEKYISLSRQGISQYPEADVFLWPETAFPDYLDSHRGQDRQTQLVRNFLVELNKPLLTGGYSTDPDRKKVYNGFFAINSDGTQAGEPYRKTLLLAFGEYFPGADLFPFVMKLFPDQSAFGRGRGPTSMKLREWNIGPQICYEGLYPWFSRGLVNSGAEFFTNVTNDSWFGRPFEPNQHMYMTFARAIEFRRPLIRSTNTGITSVMLADGTLLQKSPLHEDWFGLFSVPYKKQPRITPYTYLEPWWPYLMLVTSLAMVVFGRTRRATT